MSFCKKCGSNLKNGSKFCTSCGEKIDLSSFKPKDKPVAKTKTAKASSQSESQHDQQQDIASNNSLKNKLLGFYIILVYDI